MCELKVSDANIFFPLYTKVLNINFRGNFAFQFNAYKK